MVAGLEALVLQQDGADGGQHLAAEVAVPLGAVLAVGDVVEHRQRHPAGDRLVANDPPGLLADPLPHRDEVVDRVVGMLAADVLGLLGHLLVDHPAFVSSRVLMKSGPEPSVNARP